MCGGAVRQQAFAAIQLDQPVEHLVQAGYLGRKSKRGFRTYE